LFLVLQLYCSPYHSEALNLAQTCSLLINVFTLFVGIMLIVDANLEGAATRAGEAYDTSGRGAVSVILFLANLSVMSVPPIVAASNSDVVAKYINRILGRGEAVA
jgi:hypothetical protein